MPMRKRSKIADFCITMFFVFAMLFGIAVFCYPAFSSWWNEKAQTKVIESYNKAVGDLGGGTVDVAGNHHRTALVNVLQAGVLLCGRGVGAP